MNVMHAWLESLMNENKTFTRHALLQNHWHKPLKAKHTNQMNNIKSDYKMNIKINCNNEKVNFFTELIQMSELQWSLWRWSSYHWFIQISQIGLVQKSIYMY